MKKIAVYSLVGLLILSCSVSPPNNSTQNNSFPSPGTRHPALVKDNFADLEKEYKSFSTKALSEAYVSRMFTKFLVTTPNPTQVIRQLEFARYLKDVKSDSGYFSSLTGVISNDSSIYTKINTMPEVVSYKTANSSTFGAFVESLSPPPTNIIYVKANATGLNNGTSWVNAYTSLQNALTNATSGKDIWVASGTYKPTSGTDRFATFQLKYGVNVYGGFSGIETQLSQRNWNTNVVLLSGDLNGDDILNNMSVYKSDNSYNVVKGANNSTIDGLTISFGGDEAGGGMNNWGTSPTVSNVIFTNNLAGRLGAGMYNRGPSSPVIKNVIFKNNSAAYGGGLYNGWGALATISNVTFANNSAYDGGGMYNDYAAVTTLQNAIFWGNTATNGISIYNYGCTLKLGYSDIEGGFSGIYNNYGDPLFLKDLNGATLDNSNFAAAGNISSDPQFVSSTDFHLQSSSPARNTGTNTGAPGKDFDGISRPKGGITDMGAYEFFE